ncbi:hypothetical protein F5Y10DRAFT_201203 [Nemania abortiva]|nr:hypothetical protein F5Y10DRAFT_201203 [Nemania abortiva]
MDDTLRGSGLFQAHDALAALLDNPERLDRARSRFDNSPPVYRSQPSGTTTEPWSPDRRSDEQRRLEERENQLRLDRLASSPDEQYRRQKKEELDRLEEEASDLTRRQLLYGRGPVNFWILAEENVKKRWVEQGIWNEKWKPFHEWRWKHEEPLSLQIQEEAQDEAAARPIFRKRAEPRMRQLTSDEQARAVREREASRPFHQFVFQVSKKREQIQGRSTVDQGQGQGQPASSDFAHDINTRAYEEVKNIWIKRGIWNAKWGILPGMSWKHEQPLQEMLREELGDDYQPVPVLERRKEDDLGAGEAPSALPPNPFKPSAEPEQQTPAVPDTSQNGLPTAASPTEIHNNDNNVNNHASPAPSPPRPPTVTRGPGRKRKQQRHAEQSSQGDAQAPVLPRRSKRLREVELRKQTPSRASKRQRI